jgi:hypothetical protein
VAVNPTNKEQVMQLGTPLDAISDAIGAAAFRDMPDIEYESRDYSQKDKFVAFGDLPIVMRKRRPMPYELEVIVFAQSWGSTALGYGGMGGSAVTPAYTVIVIHGPVYCVYFGSGGRLAYAIDTNELTGEGGVKFQEDMRSFCMADKRTATIRYVRKGTNTNATPAQSTPTKGQKKNRIKKA